jgi:hypothetical protein
MSPDPGWVARTRVGALWPRWAAGTCRAALWPRRVARTGAAALATLALASCGSSSLSAAQIRSRATKICTATARRTGKIDTPASPGGGVAFLNRGIAAINLEVNQLRAMHATGTARTAVDGTAAELAALRFTLKGLHADNDPVIAIKTLERRLAPIEQRTNTAWRTLDIPACVTT